MSRDPSDGAIVVGYLVGLVLGFFLKAWLLMLVLGGLHHEVSDSVPAVGYPGALLLSLAVGLLLGGVRAARTASNA